MELDARIRSLDDVLTCFDIEKAKQFIGQMGYFAGDLYCFSDVEQLCPYDKLVNVFDQDDAFYRGDITFPFFIPECFLKSVEKKEIVLKNWYKTDCKNPDGITVKEAYSLGFNRACKILRKEKEKAEGKK